MNTQNIKTTTTSKGERQSESFKPKASVWGKAHTLLFKLGFRTEYEMWLVEMEQPVDGPRFNEDHLFTTLPDYYMPEGCRAINKTLEGCLRNVFQCWVVGGKIGVATSIVQARRLTR